MAFLIAIFKSCQFGRCADCPGVVGSFRCNHSCHKVAG